MATNLFSGSMAVIVRDIFLWMLVIFISIEIIFILGSYIYKKILNKSEINYFPAKIAGPMTLSFIVIAFNFIFIGETISNIRDDGIEMGSLVVVLIILYYGILIYKMLKSKNYFSSLVFYSILAYWPFIAGLIFSIVAIRSIDTF